MDERSNKPSASYIEQMSLCPGSWLTQQGLPEQSSEDAASGTLIHAALAGQADPLAEHQEAVDFIRSKESGIRSDVIVGAYGKYTEQRYWQRGGRYSGKADSVFVAIPNNTILICDYKTGRNEVAIAEGNLQLRALVPLVAHAWGYNNRIYAAIIPAYARPTVVLYEGDDIKRAEAETLAIIDAAEKPDAPRVPSEKACRYCRAKMVCDEYREQGVIAMHETHKADKLISSAPSGAFIKADTLALYLDFAKQAESYIENLRAEAKRRLAAGEDIPGWKLSQGKAREKIVNLPTVHARFVDAAIDSGAFAKSDLPLKQIEALLTNKFTAACSLTKKAAKEMLQAATGEKGKKLDDLLYTLTAGCKAEGDLPEPTLERVKEAA